MFLSNLYTTAQQVLILYILVAVGFAADKAGIYTEKASRLTTDLLFYIITPAVIIESFMSIEKTGDSLRGLGYAAICGVVIHVIAILLSLPFFNKGEDKTKGIYKYAAVFGNCGYMALPLAKAVLGAQGVFYCSAVIMVFNVFAFTYGIRIMSEKGAKFETKKLFVNPGTIGVAIGLPLFLLGVELPVVAAEPLGYISSLNTPLAMLIFGTYLANTDIKTMFLEWRIYLVAMLKLAVLPLACLGLFRLCGVRGALLTAMLVSASAPSANNTVLFSAKYGRDTGTASKTVAVVSFLSVVTMPVMIALASTLA